MSSSLRNVPITSAAYRSSITDRSFIEILKSRGVLDYVKVQSSNNTSSVEYKTEPDKKRRRNPRGNPSSIGQSGQIWTSDRKIRDTSGSYRRNYKHLGLWTRISRNSGGTLPKEIEFCDSESIINSDRESISNYLTPSRSIRKCSLTVFSECSKRSGTSIGLFEGCKSNPYRCQPIGLSVESLSKNTHAGTDTMGKKNSLSVQKRVKNQVRDIFRNPTSRKIYSLNPSVLREGTALDYMFSLPEIIFHRFQAVYEPLIDSCIEKSRVVWCVPYTIVVLEKIFFGSAIDSVVRKMSTTNSVIYPLGLTNYQIGQRSVRSLREDFYMAFNDNQKIYSLDFKKFDSSIPMWAKDLFFATMKDTLELTPKEEMVYDFLRIYVKYTPFLYDGKINIKQKGISSGLLITNLFDTWWNLTIHHFVDCIINEYPEKIDEILSDDVFFDTLFMDKSKILCNKLFSEPQVRVMGDDSIILCDEFKLTLHKKICFLLGMSVTIKHVTHKPTEDIFFLGRFWNIDNRPHQSEEHISLRIVYTRWYDDKSLPFDLKDLHLYRILSICLPFYNGKEFLDKYLYDYQPYIDFVKSKKGFIYIKDFIEENFSYKEYKNSFDVDSY